MSAAKKCCFQKPDGTACRAAATASGYCFFHDGDKAAEAGRKGGKRSHKAPVILPADAEDIPLATVGDVVKALASTFNKVQRGLLDPKTGNCLALISGQLLKAMQGGELAAELEALRAEVEAQKHERRNNATANPEAPRANSDAEGGTDAVSGAHSAGPGAGDDSGGTDAGPVASEAVAEELESCPPPLFPTIGEEPGCRSAGVG